MRDSKATKRQVRQHNRQLVLRLVYGGVAVNRAALAAETDLTKPAISDLVNDLLDEGYLVEGGLGQSAEAGGKRPRLLEFVPAARQVIGMSIAERELLGVLTNLDGSIIAEHSAPIPREDEAALPLLLEAINGLVAQLSAPLLSIGIGIAGVVDSAGEIRYTPGRVWRDLPLRSHLEAHYRVPVYCSNSTELAARAQVAFGGIPESDTLLTVLVNGTVGVGAVAAHAIYHLGSDIGYLIPDRDPSSLQQRLAWETVQARAADLARHYDSPSLLAQDLSYLHIAHAAAQQDPAARQLCQELAATLAEVVAWGAALLRPQHVVLAGDIADLGQAFLNEVVAAVRQRILPKLVEDISFALDNTPNLVALGAAAKSVQAELGLVR